MKPPRFPVMRLMLTLACLLGGLVAVAPLCAQPTDPRPFPAIEAGMHTAMINRIAVDAAGRYAVTASDDKTARVWELSSGKLLQVLRVPVGENQEGKLYAVALSPDGRLVALGGWTGHPGLGANIYLFDRASGRMLGRIGGVPTVVNHLAFSTDGHRLAAALGGGNGIRLYAAEAPWRELAGDTNYGDSSYSVDFDHRGRLVATSWDGKLRLYDEHLTPLVAPRTVPGGERPFFARFSPDGRRIAVGFDDSTAVRVVSGDDLELRYPVDTRGADNGDLSKVAWSADGETLYAAGMNVLGDGQTPVRGWPQQGRGPMQAWPVATDNVMDLQPLADGRLIYAASDPAWGVLDARGHRLVQQPPPILDHRGNYDEFRVSAAGDVVEFQQKTWRDGRWQSRLAHFDLAARRLERGVSPLAGLHAPRTEGLAVTDWEHTTHPRLAGQPLALSAQYERSRSLAVSPDAQRFALGAEWAVYLFDHQGQMLWRKPTPSVAWLVNLSADGGFVVAALGDGSLRWYRTDDEGSEALALFVHADGERWVLWTPEGFYDAAPGADDLIGYHLNQRRDQAGEFVASGRLAKQFYRPDLIARRLAGDEAAMAAAVREVGDVRQVLTAGLRPEVTLISDATADSAGEYELKLKVQARSGGVGQVEIRINGAALEGRTSPPTGGMLSQRLPLAPGRNVITAAVYDRANKQASEPVQAVVTVQPSGVKPTLHVLAVGVTNYRDGTLAKGVRFAADDAVAFARTLKRHGLAEVEAVTEPVLLTDQRATRERIVGELEAFAQKVRPADLFVLYLAGHGTSLEDGEYYYLPWGLRYTGQAAIKEQALSGPQLRALLARINATKTLVVLDSCSSGAFTRLQLAGRDLGDKGSIDRFARLSGRVVLAAAGDQRMALESPDNQHGIYTDALIRGLQGTADTSRNGLVEVGELADFVEAEVARVSLKLFNYEQFPMRDIQGQNFPVSRKLDEVDR